MDNQRQDLVLELDVQPHIAANASRAERVAAQDRAISQVKRQVLNQLRGYVAADPNLRVFADTIFPVIVVNTIRFLADQLAKEPGVKAVSEADAFAVAKGPRSSNLE
jgi:hypothetical protein